MGERIDLHPRRDAPRGPRAAARGRGPRPATVLLVDGSCALCGRLTRLVVALDRRRRLRFAALASPRARAILARHGALLSSGVPPSGSSPSSVPASSVPPSSVPPSCVPPSGGRPSGAPPREDDTFRALIDQGLPGERLLARSDAALHVVRELGAPWCALTVLALLPRRWRDGLYDLVARQRRRLVRGACPLPRATEAWRFLDAEPAAAPACDATREERA